MSIVTVTAAALGTVALIIHVLSVALAVRGLASRKRPAWPTCLPPISVVRPVCGLTEIDKMALLSTFQLDYSDHEIIFCAEREDDISVPYCRELIEQHPNIQARLLIGRTMVSANPKLDNVEKGWNGAQHDHIVMADCNVLMPPDYLQVLLAAWSGDCGLVCAPPVGIDADGLWAEVESAFLNTYQARWQYAADSVGLGFAQGKSMLWRRGFLNARGGIGALAAEVAEDAAATKLVRAAGLNVRLARRPSLQPLGRRTLAQVWQRQLRWAQLRRQSFPREFALEILTTLAIPLSCAVLVAASQDDDLYWLAPLAVLTVWFGAEGWLARRMGWGFSWITLLAISCRELMIPAVWSAAWRATGYVWHGQHVSLDAKSAATVLE